MKLGAAAVWAGSRQTVALRGAGAVPACRREACDVGRVFVSLDTSRASVPFLCMHRSPWACDWQRAAAGVLHLADSLNRASTDERARWRHRRW